MFTVDSLSIEDTRLCLSSSSKGPPHSTVQLPCIILGPLSTACQNNYILSSLSRDPLSTSWFLMADIHVL